ncbi:protein PET100 homolog, mitochondrial [Lycorma delicatula]|uniref:protein PET100 homolog, mitochondrial n=1 Tax=Lycorma delicatula TaxID=130591 RepID=UPI003F50D8B6
MGNWKLEVGKMVIYMAFPVAMFHYFHQVSLFEEEIIRFKQEQYPPDIIARGEELRRKLQEYNAEVELARLKDLEKANK